MDTKADNGMEDHRVVSVRPIQGLGEGPLIVSISDYLFFKHDASLEDLTTDRYYSKRLLGVRIKGRKLLMNVEDLPVLKQLLERLMNGEGVVIARNSNGPKPTQGSAPYAAASPQPRRTYIRDGPRPYTATDPREAIRDFLMGRGRYFGLDRSYRR